MRISPRWWIVTGCFILALAGCVSAGAPPPKQQASEDIPAVLRSCGRIALATPNEAFELCGIAPEGEKTAQARYQIFTQGCGVVEVTEDLKHYICRIADGAFTSQYPARSSAFVTANFENKTRADYDQRGGNQLIYFAASGAAYFWFPNQTKVLEGEWMVYRSAQLCLHLQGLTEHANTRWQCFAMTPPDPASEIAEGDVAGLTRHKGRAPWMLQAQPRMMLAQVVERVKTLPDGIEPSTEPPKGKGGAPVPVPLAPMVRNGDEPVGLVLNEPPPHLFLNGAAGSYATIDSPTWAAELFTPAPSQPVR